MKVYFHSCPKNIGLWFNSNKYVTVVYLWFICIAIAKEEKNG